MKKIYGVAMVLIIFMALAIVAWGAWLNYSDENQIANRMDNRRVEVTAAKAARREFAPTISLDAVRFVSDNMTDAVALTDGRILSWQVEKNEKVSKGQNLVEMVNESIPLKIQQAESAISRAEAMMTQARNSYQRQGRLKARRATSQEKYEEAEAQYMAAQGALREAQAQRDQYLVQQGWLSVKAPLDGEVLLIYQQAGAQVQAGTPIALVGNFSRLFFSMPIDDRHAKRIAVGDSAELSFTSSQILRKAYDTEYAAGNRGDAEVFSISVRDIMPPLNEPATLRKIVWEVDNRVGLLEQQAYSGAVLRSTRSRRLLAVPLAAMTDSHRNAVFVVTPQSTIERREVKTGVDDGEYIEILTGLNEGETVITSASEGLEDNMKVTVNLIGGDNS